MLSGVTAAVSPIRVPLQALAVALAGAGLAWLWLNDEWLVGLGGAVLAILLGMGLDQIAVRLLPKKPVAAIYVFQGWLLIPLALAVVASAIAIVVAIELTLPEGTSTETKELVGAASTGIISFLTAGFISWAADEKNSGLADHVKEGFEGSYGRPGNLKDGQHAFASGSDGDLWVHSDEVAAIKGWSWKARLTRAHGIAGELASGESDPPKSSQSGR